MLKRLTKRDERKPEIVHTICENCYCKGEHCSGWECAQALAKRLADYEDTGHTPEEIQLFGEDKPRISISKKVFCEALSLIQKQDEVNEQFSKALELVGNGHFVFGTENHYLHALLLVLVAAVNDKYEYIEWWLYETSNYMVQTADGSQTWDLSTPDALYDYIVQECQ